MLRTSGFRKTPEVKETVAMKTKPIARRRREGRFGGGGWKYEGTVRGQFWMLDRLQRCAANSRQVVQKSLQDIYPIKIVRGPATNNRSKPCALDERIRWRSYLA